MSEGNLLGIELLQISWPQVEDRIICGLFKLLFTIKLCSDVYHVTSIAKEEVLLSKRKVNPHSIIRKDWAL